MSFLLVISISIISLSDMKSLSDVLMKKVCITITFLIISHIQGLLHPCICIFGQLFFGFFRPLLKEFYTFFSLIG